MKHLKRTVQKKKKNTQKLSLHLETWESDCEAPSWKPTALSKPQLAVEAEALLMGMARDSCY